MFVTFVRFVIFWVCPHVPSNDGIDIECQRARQKEREGPEMSAKEL